MKSRERAFERETSGGQAGEMGGRGRRQLEQKGKQKRGEKIKGRQTDGRMASHQ